jgi:hypothetical protein
MTSIDRAWNDAFFEARTFRIFVAMAQPYHLRIEFAVRGVNVKSNAFTRPDG